MLLPGIQTKPIYAAASLRGRPFVTFIFVFGLGVAGWGPTLSFLSVYVRQALGGTILSAALVFLAIHSVASTLGLASGLWIRRFGSKSTYALGLAGITAFVCGLALAPDFRWIIALGPILGLFLSFHWTGLQSYVIEATPATKRGQGSGIAAFVMVLGPGISGPLLGGLAERLGIRWLEYGAAALLVTALVLLALALPSLHGEARAPRDEGGLRLRAYGGLFKSRPVAWSLLVRSATSVPFCAFTLLAGPKLIEAGGGLQSVGLFVAAGAIGGGAAQMVVGRLSDLVGRRLLLIVAVILGIASAVLFGWAGSIPILLVASSVQWFSQGAFQTLLVAVAGDIAPGGEMGRVMALQTSAFSWGMVAGSLAVGLLAPVNAVLPFYLAAGVLLLALLGTLRMSGGNPSQRPATPARAG